MSSSSQPVPTTAESEARVPAAMTDASCRWPLLGLYSGAAFWLALSALAYLLASMSFHAPGMFAECAGLSYGRMAPVADNLLVYGFCIPAGWAAMLWSLARLGRTELAQGAMVMVATKIWNLGVLVGGIGILAGDASGYRLLEFPLYAAWMLVLGAILVGISGLNTLLNRTERTLHPVQGIAGLSVLWFPWIYITAAALVQLWPVRGMAQGVVHWWFLAELQIVLLGLFGVASLFYFLPVFKQQPLGSRQLAWFALFTLIFVGGWMGVPMSAPVPAWMAALSRVASIFLVLPTLAVALNVLPLQSAKGVVEFRFVRFGFRVLLVWTALVLITNGSGLWRMTAFTLFQPGLFQLFAQGFSVMISLGAAYWILPRISGIPLRFPVLIKAHFALVVTGLLLWVIPFLVGGLQQGRGLTDARIAFADVALGALMPIRVASTGQMLLILGHLLLGINVAALMIRLARTRLKAFDNEPVRLAGATEGGA